MTLIAEVRLSHPDFVLADTLASDTGASVRLDYQTAAEPDDRFLFLRVAGVDPEAFERRLERDHTVADPRLVAMFADHAIFRVGVRADLEIVPRSCTALGARVLEVTNDGDGWRVRLQLFTRDAFDAFREYCRRRSVSYEVHELTNVDDFEGKYSFGLTEQQRTTVLLAYNAGYYEIPRAASQDELAGELGISKSAVSQRLRRAITVLIENTLVTDQY